MVFEKMQPAVGLVSRSGTSRGLTLAVLVAGLALASPGHAAVVSIDGIAAAPGSDYTPDDRLGLVPAQATDTTVKHIINIADCQAIRAATSPIVRITWSWLDKPALQLTPQFAVKIAAPGTTCDGNNFTETSGSTNCLTVTKDHSFANGLTAAGEITDINLHDILGDTPCTQNVDADATLYFIVNPTPTGGTTTYSGVPLPIHLGLKRPLAPTLDSVTPGGNNLKVSWTQVDTTSGVTMSAKVYWSTSPFTAGDLANVSNHSDVLTSTSYQITGLTNGTPYYVAVVAVDSSENESVGSKVLQAVPIQVQDMWAYYKANGGAEEGGFAPCSAAPTGRMAPGIGGLLLFAGLAIWLTRRRKRLHGLPILVLALGAVVPARSEAVSPQTSSMEFRAGYYEPNIDREFETTNKAKPFADIMTDGDWQMGGSVDWRIWHGFGEFAMGLGADRWKHDGRSRTLSGTTTTDTTTLQIVPITVDLVYRFDVLAERWDFPLVPYAKIGGAYALWWMQDGVGNLSHYVKDGKTFTAQGGTGGFQGVLGMRLLLDVFEPQAARSFDIEMGVNHSYIFAEYRSLVLTDFGNPKSIDLSADIFSAGIAFDL